MKHTKLILIGVLAAIPLLGWAVGVDAQSFKNGDNVTVAKNQTVDSTLYASGSNIDIAGKVNGDVICAGQNIVITGEVTGDVICAGQTIDITARIGGDVRVASQTVTLGGTVGDNVSVLSQTFTSKNGSQIDGDVSVAAKNVTLNGSVQRDLSAGATNLIVNGNVGRDITSRTDEITLGSQANVGGSIDYNSNQELNRENGATVAGSIDRNQIVKQEGNNSNGPLIGFALYLIVSMLLIALLLVLLAPQVFQGASNLALANWGRTLVSGIIATLVVPIVIFGLMITLVGVPLALILLLAWAIVLFLSGPFAAYFLGRLILRSRPTVNAVWTMLLGSAILLVLYLIPILNFFVVLAVVWFGVGMILRQIRFSKPHYTYQTASVSAAPTPVKTARAKTAAKKKKTSRS